MILIATTFVVVPREENSRLREKLQVFQFRLETLLVDLKAEDNEPSPTLEASTGGYIPSALRFVDPDLDESKYFLIN